MLKQIYIFLVLAGLTAATQLKAQSAVYFCSITGEYGFCYGESTSMKARECAYTNCIKAGGSQPVLVSFTAAKGFGAICKGEDYLGNTIIGVAMGFDTQAEADKAAENQCSQLGGYKYRIREQWEDK